MGSDKPEWFSVTRRPKAYVSIICLGADDIEYWGLCYSSHRRELIEPITNKEAEPVIGPIKGWRYYPKDSSRAFQSLTGSLTGRPGFFHFLSIPLFLRRVGGSSMGA